MAAVPQPPSGHVFRVERKHGPVWYAKYRLPDGRQVQKKIGPAWTGRGRPRRWAGNKYKRLRAYQRFKHWWTGLHQRQPNLFAQWRWVRPS